MATEKKVCKKCKSFVEGEKCLICEGTQFGETWKGKLFVNKPEESELAKKMGITKKGVYAIKIK